MTGTTEDLIEPDLKGYDCTDRDPVEHWVPQSDVVDFTLTLHIGRLGDAGADMYQVRVLTPSGLAAAKQSGRGLAGPAPIILSEYSWKGVLEEVHTRLRKCRGFGWLDVQEKLRKMFAWEYEGYR